MKIPCGGLEGSMAILRRNVHRLEKGLLMQPRRLPLRLDYIGETVAAFVIASAADDRCGRVPLGTRCSNRILQAARGPADARCSCGKLRGRRGSDPAEPSRIPYRRDLSPLRVDLDGLRDLAKRRRSVRWFLQKPVPREAIDQAIEVGTQAPVPVTASPLSSASSMIRSWCKR